MLIKVYRKELSASEPNESKKHHFQARTLYPIVAIKNDTFSVLPPKIAENTENEIAIFYAQMRASSAEIQQANALYHIGNFHPYGYYHYCEDDSSKDIDVYIYNENIYISMIEAKCLVKAGFKSINDISTTEET